jgi:hypothetical protein
MSVISQIQTKSAGFRSGIANLRQKDMMIAAPRFTSPWTLNNDEGH